MKLLSAKLLLATLALAAFSPITTKNKAMFTNKEIVQELFEQALNQKKTEIFQDIIDADFAGPQGQKGPAAFHAIFDPLLHAFPDIRYTIEDMVGEGDKVAVRWSWQGTQSAAFRNIPPTGKHISNEGATVFVLKNGKISAGSTITDRLGFLQQLGVITGNF